jgi:NADH-quinone oxidoreductase subunit A
MSTTFLDTPYWPLVAYLGLAVAAVAGLTTLSHILGPRHQEQATGEPFESGIVHLGSGRLRFPVHFYLVAVLFVIFDLETVFILAWAVVVRETGWAGYVEILIFVGVLGVALGYLWRIGALDRWRAQARSPRTRIEAN